VMVKWTETLSHLKRRPGTSQRCLIWKWVGAPPKVHQIDVFHFKMYKMFPRGGAFLHKCRKEVNLIGQKS